VVGWEERSTASDTEVRRREQFKSEASPPSGNVSQNVLRSAVVSDDLRVFVPPWQKNSGVSPAETAEIRTV
jgi:hypothetical protein